MTMTDEIMSGGLVTVVQAGGGIEKEKGEEEEDG